MTLAIAVRMKNYWLVEVLAVKSISAMDVLHERLSSIW